MLVPGVELASCCWVSGLGLSLLAGGGPPCSPPWVPCWALCPVWLQLGFWLSGWLSALALLSSGETKMVENKNKSNNDNIDSYHTGNASLVSSTQTQKIIYTTYVSGDTST